jgi:hypothetical protein
MYRVQSRLIKPASAGRLHDTMLRCTSTSDQVPKWAKSHVALVVFLRRTMYQRRMMLQAVQMKPRRKTAQILRGS